jgi:hypothetical protein
MSVLRNEGFATDADWRSRCQQVLMAVIDDIAEPLVGEPKRSSSLSDPATSRFQSLGDYSMLKLKDLRMKGFPFGTRLSFHFS